MSCWLYFTKFARENALKHTKDAVNSTVYGQNLYIQNQSFNIDRGLHSVKVDTICIWIGHSIKKLQPIYCFGYRQCQISVNLYILNCCTSFTNGTKNVFGLIFVTHFYPKFGYAYPEIRGLHYEIKNCTFSEIFNVISEFNRHDYGGLDTKFRNFHPR
jgi:hypothetical protein